jgi:low affinity Fe/Cu permease
VRAGGRGLGRDGPAFHFSQTWQLVINTGTTIVTFLMVFLIQNTQNRDSLALQTKLDELILTSDAENEFIGIERLTDHELEALHARCAFAAKAHERLARRAKAEISTRRLAATPAGISPRTAAHAACGATEYQATRANAGFPDVPDES